MQLDELTINPRQRNEWDALDLGFALARRWWWPLFFSWLIPASIVAVIFHGLLYAWPQYALVAVWWIKPLLERFPLYILSRRVFGEPSTVRDALRDFRNFCRFDLLPWLTWRRFNPMRAFVMPVTQLEQLTGKRRDRRLNVLQRESSGSALWLFLVCLHIEVILPLVMIGTGLWLVPADLDIDPWTLIFEQDLTFLLLINGLTLLAMALVAPFYVAAGFTLYLNRRVALEGWDIEIAFRQLAKRAASKSGSGLAAIALCIFLVSGLTSSPSVEAEDIEVDSVEKLHTDAAHESMDPNVPLSPQMQARIDIEDILAGEAFHESASFVTWQRRGAEEGGKKNSPDEIPEWIINLIEWLENHWPEWTIIGDLSFKDMLALLLKGAVSVFLISIVIYVLMRYREKLRLWVSADERHVEKVPEMLFGMDVREESLPTDIVTQVKSLWAAGKLREAMALLYRATLSRMIHQHGLAFSDAMTENECAALVSQARPPEAARYFNRMTRIWLRLAYGHIEPSEEHVNELCEQWEGVLDHG